MRLTAREAIWLGKLDAGAELRCDEGKLGTFEFAALTGALAK